MLLKGRVKHFLKAWEILTKDPEILEIVKRFKIPFLKNPTQDRVPQTPQMGQEQAALLQVEIENILKKGAIQQTEHQPWEYLSQWRKSPCGELKIFKPVHFISAFHNGRFVLPLRITTRGKLHVQAGYERCLFFSSTASVIKELCSLFMIRESLRVPLFMIRLGTLQVAENTNFCTEEDEYPGSNIFGRHAYNGSSDGKNFHVQRHLNLPPEIFKFCFKPGEVHFESISGKSVP